MKDFMNKKFTVICALCLSFIFKMEAQREWGASMKNPPLPKVYTQNIGKEHFPKRANLPLYDSIYYWTFDTAAAGWDFNSKEVKIVYNAGNKIASQLIQDWNGSAWVNFTADTFYFNANNLDTTDIEQAWTGTKWENEYWYTYTYNASDSETSEVEQIWTGSTWRNYQKYVYTYDAHNNKTNLMALQWSGSNWSFSYHYAYTYNSNNLKIMEVDSTAASTERWLYSYNINNLLVDDSSQYWTGSGWATDFNYMYTYNASNSDTSEVIQQWTGSVWAGYEKYTYTYDASQNMIGQLYYTWTGNATEKFQQYAYTYDANNNMLSEEMKQFFDAGTRVILGDSIYWYFHKTTGINEAKDNGNLLVYPNPSNGKFTIQIKNGQWLMANGTMEVGVYNQLGQQVFSESATANYPSSIDLSNRPDGIYFLILKGGQGEMKTKLVIQR